jgi:hypothetical protein
MKPWLKWTLGGLAIALLTTGALRTLTARQARQAALGNQQIAQKRQVSLNLVPTDLVQVKTGVLLYERSGPVVKQTLATPWRFSTAKQGYRQPCQLKSIDSVNIPPGVPK